MLPSDKVAEFAEFVRAAPFDAKAERIVRTMLGKVSAGCPMDVLVQLAETVINCRRAELRAEAERN